MLNALQGGFAGPVFSSMGGALGEGYTLQVTSDQRRATSYKSQVGMLIGGQILAAGVSRLRLRAAYAASAALALLALRFARGGSETLPRSGRDRFELRGSRRSLQLYFVACSL